MGESGDFKTIKINEICNISLGNIQAICYGKRECSHVENVTKQVTGKVVFLS